MHEFVTFLGAPRDVGVVTFKLTLSCKEGRYRYILTEFVLNENETISINLEQINKPDDLSANQLKELKNDVNKKMKDLAA